MASRQSHSLLDVGNRRWAAINGAQDAARDTRARGMTVSELLDRGQELSRTAAEFRRAAWETQRGSYAAA